MSQAIGTAFASTPVDGAPPIDSAGGGSAAPAEGGDGSGAADSGDASETAPAGSDAAAEQ